ncbi:MAG: helix-turn-helix domain-containing protein [Ktedonobacterales bacterium]|nr:helix-turn-helix domain-containing protein [Ktedonobacterales bacterium]
MAENTIYTVEEVARQLSVHADTVRGWIRSGELAAFDLGGRAGYRITQASLDEFVRKRQATKRDE